MKLFLVRHGTTEWMEIKRLHGSTDSPLSEKGRFQAQQAGLALKDSDLEYIFCSPQGRAQETAGYIAGQHNIEAQPQDWLREMHFGIHEGSMHSIYRFPVTFIRRPMIRLLHLFDTGRYGESWKTARQRVAEGWQQMLDQGIDGRVALVSHSLALENLITCLMKRYSIPLNGRPELLKPASVSEFDIDLSSNTLQTVRYNDVSHYRQAAA